MNASSMYRVPDEDDQGCSDSSLYLIVNSVGYYEFESYYRMTHRPLGRKDFYLGYNYRGPMTVRCGGRECVLRPGSVFVFRPGEEQYYGHRNEQKFLSYWVHFTGYGVDEVLREAKLDGAEPAFAGVHPDIAGVFEDLMSEVRNKKAGYELASASLLGYLLAVLSRRIEQGDGVRTDGNREEIYESMKYIHDNYAREIYVAELADLAHLSADRFTTLFKSVTGTTPMRYLLRFRLQRACELMKHTRLNIQQIAGAVGFDDQLYFSRMFKKAYGVTPTGYSAKFG